MDHNLKPGDTVFIRKGISGYRRSTKWVLQRATVVRAKNEYVDIEFKTRKATTAYADTYHVMHVVPEAQLKLVGEYP